MSIIYGVCIQLNPLCNVFVFSSFSYHIHLTGNWRYGASTKQVQNVYFVVGSAQQSLMLIKKSNKCCTKILHGKLWNVVRIQISVAQKSYNRLL